MRATILLLTIVLCAAPGEYSIVEQSGRFWLSSSNGQLSFYVLESCREVRLPEAFDPFATAIKNVPQGPDPVCWTPPADTSHWVAAIRKASSDSEGKQMYVSFLKERYGYNIGRVNQAYGLEASAFTDLAESDFRTLDPRREAVVNDDRDFGQILVIQSAGMLRRHISRSTLLLFRATDSILAPYANALIVDQTDREWPNVALVIRVRHPGKDLAERIARNPRVIGVEGPASFAGMVKERIPQPAIP